MRTIQQIVKERAFQVYVEDGFAARRRGWQSSSLDNWLRAEFLLGISHADVQKAAYYIYLKRRVKGLPGTAEDDWLVAQKKLFNESQMELHRHRFAKTAA